jgi:acetate kinase
MLILVINAGSSSIKYQLLNMPQGNFIIKGILERIGEKKSFIQHELRNKIYLNKKVKVRNHRQGINLILSLLMDRKFGVIKSLRQIFCVGHRVVHGMEIFKKPVFIDKNILAKIRECAKLAPLHNPPAELAIEACLEALKDVPQVAVFDTAFHSSIPAHAFIYGLPYAWYERFGIRRYGFHGLSHEYVAEEAARILRKPLARLRLITCHLGNGCSITAIKHGRSVDTSMGFTPLEGVVMGTRPGDFDPAIILFLLKKKYTIGQIEDILNRRSGLLGLSGISNDMRDIIKAAKKNNPRARLARDIFVYRIQKYIGAYIAVLDGLDALVFTGGVGENQGVIRSRICKGLRFLLGATGARVLVTKTDEEQIIARQAYDIIVNTEKLMFTPQNRKSSAKAQK